MKLYFSEEELNHVGSFLMNLILKMRPPRETRRKLKRLAEKFRPNAKYVWLKPGQRQDLSRILNGGVMALDTTEANLKKRKFTERFRSFVKGNPEKKKIEAIGGVFGSVLEKLDNANG